jgi:G6PDH family F420-dependent oxidoreductase
MSGNRFSLAVGAGERLNEHVTGLRWPSVPERHEMLGEAVDIFRTLWKGGVHSWKGDYFTVDHAQLYDLPDQPIPIIMGVSGDASIALAAAKADGIMTTEPKADLVSGFQAKRKRKGPCYAEAVLAYAPTRKEALQTAHERFKFSAFGWAVNSELPSVQGFEAAGQYVRQEDIAESIAAGPDIQEHVTLVRKYVDAGYDHIVLTCPGNEQGRFMDFFRDKLRPALEKIA